MTEKIIFDTDPGIDDTMALLFAHAAPDIDLVGITTVFGNGYIDTVTQNALYVCERFGINAPVCQGAAAPLLVDLDEPPTFVHGDDALGNTTAPRPGHRVGDQYAAGFIIDTILQNPGEITLVAVGRMTNLAMALRINPSIASQVKRVIVMGGAVSHPVFTGNVTPVAEANFHGDPHAADIVMTAPWPVTLVGLNVTMQCVMDTPRVQQLRHDAGEVGQFIWDITRHYEAFYRSSHSVEGFAVHDSCAIAYLLAPTLFTEQSGTVRVITEGISRGQTIQVPADRRFPPSAWDALPKQQACIGIDALGVLDLYARTLAKA